MLRHHPAKTKQKPNRQPKVDLEIYRVPAFRVYYKKLEAYVAKVFGFEFDFLLATGCGEGICPDYAVDGKLPTTEWKRRADQVRAGRRTKCVPLIMNTLAADGKIPRGLYTVSTHIQPTPLSVYQELLRRTADPKAEECMAFKAKHDCEETFRLAVERLDRHFVTYQ